jgi:hypothetical protein
VFIAATIVTALHGVANPGQRFGQDAQALPVLDRALTCCWRRKADAVAMDDNIGLLVLSAIGLIVIVSVFAVLLAAAVADGRIERAYRDGSHLR